MRHSPREVERHQDATSARRPPSLLVFACASLVLSAASCSHRGEPEDRGPNASAGGEGASQPDEAVSSRASSPGPQPDPPVARPEPAGLGEELVPGDCPACFSPSGLPALSPGGERVALLVPVPTYTDLAAACVEATAWTFAIVRLSDGGVDASVPLTTHADLMRERDALTNCCSWEEDDACDPDLCVPDEELAEGVEADFESRVRDRLARARALLGAGRWSPLQEAEELGGQLDVEVDEARGRVSVRLSRAGRTLLEETVDLPCPDCSEVSADGYIHPTEPVQLVRITMSNLDRTTEATHFAAAASRAP